jgi:hypothetical protein
MVAASNTSWHQSILCVCARARACVCGGRSSHVSIKLSVVDLLTDPVCRIFGVGKKWGCIQTSVKPVKWQNALQCWSTEVVKSFCLQYMMLCFCCKSIVHGWVVYEALYRQYECSCNFIHCVCTSRDVTECLIWLFFLVVTVGGNTQVSDLLTSLFQASAVYAKINKWYTFNIRTFLNFF